MQMITRCSKLLQRRLLMYCMAAYGFKDLTIWRVLGYCHAFD